MQQLLAELRRVLRPTGRLAVVAMATASEGQSDSLVEKTYKWMHQHFPHIVDCRPIDAVAKVTAAGFEVVDQRRLDLWTMPVVALVAHNR
jgi:demethylmenaquinone methyltransferase/2-methoxy-6-polyprenyl-1,4-benzoquinol methylase